MTGTCEATTSSPCGVRNATFSRTSAVSSSDGSVKRGSRDPALGGLISRDVGNPSAVASATLRGHGQIRSEFVLRFHFRPRFGRFTGRRQ